VASGICFPVLRFDPSNHSDLFYLSIVIDIGHYCAALRIGNRLSNLQALSQSESDTHLGSFSNKPEIRPLLKVPKNYLLDYSVLLKDLL